jgi:hypothetical protein
MATRRRADPPRSTLARPEVFMVREHALSIASMAEGRWTVSVDGGALSGTFGSQVEAWEAGVRAADAHEPQHPA